MSFGFKNRTQAGSELAGKLKDYAGRDDLVVLGLARGGIPVAYEVAKRLRAPLDVFVVRKLGVPGQEELAFGAIASGGTRVLNQGLVRVLGITPSMIERITEREELELDRREKLYRGSGPPREIRGRTVIIVDDGLATGATMHAAVRALRKLEPKAIVVAAPVCARETAAEFEKDADTLCICAITPEPFYGVGMWYQDFSQTGDDEVRELLEEAHIAAAVPKAA